VMKVDPPRARGGRRGRTVEPYDRLLSPRDPTPSSADPRRAARGRAHLPATSTDTERHDRGGGDEEGRGGDRWRLLGLEAAKRAQPSRHGRDRSAPRCRG
jgi:hypothetical protein